MHLTQSTAADTPDESFPYLGRDILWDSAPRTTHRANSVDLGKWHNWYLINIGDNDAPLERRCCLVCLGPCRVCENFPCQHWHVLLGMMLHTSHYRDSVVPGMFGRSIRPHTHDNGFRVQHTAVK